MESRKHRVTRGNDGEILFYRYTLYVKGQPFVTCNCNPISYIPQKVYNPYSLYVRGKLHELPDFFFKKIVVVENDLKTGIVKKENWKRRIKTEVCWFDVMRHCEDGVSKTWNFVRQLNADLQQRFSKIKGT